MKLIIQDLNLNTTENFDKLTNSAGRDNKSFAGLVRVKFNINQSLGILKDDKIKAPVFTLNQIKNSTLKRFPKYVRNRCYIVPEYKDDAIQTLVYSFLKNKINSLELQQGLSENNINSNVEEVYPE